MGKAEHSNSWCFILRPGGLYLLKGRRGPGNTHCGAFQRGVQARLIAHTLPAGNRAWVIASCYVDCVLLQGREIPGVISALAGSPELESIKREYDVIFLGKCRDALAPFAVDGVITQAGLRGMRGAAEALSHAAASGEISALEAQEELFASIKSMVSRGAR